MLARLSLIAATATLSLATSAFATTIVGGATLTDTATVHNGTVAIGPTLSYVTGGNGVTGTADGSSYTIGAFSPSTALSAADHVWAQFDPALLFFSSIATNALIAIPALDHGWTPDNSGEFWEPFEFRIFGCTSTGECLDEGVITDVWTRGIDDTGPGKNADDWTTRWAFTGSYNFFALVSGDRLVGGPFSPGEGEIDALAIEAPEPSALALIAAALLSLFGLGLARRRTV